MEKALERYFEYFGENYPLMIADTKTEAEIIERINYCINNDVKETEPEYDENADY